MDNRGDLKSLAAAPSVWLLLSLVVFVRLAFHFGFFLPNQEQLGWFRDDNYDEIAHSLIEQGEYVIEPGQPAAVHRLPGYPLFLVAHFSLWGDGQTALAWVQSFLQAGAALFYAYLALLLYRDLRLSRLVILLFALHPLSWLQASYRNTESLYILFFAISLVLTYQAAVDNKKSLAPMALAWGLTTLIRSPTLISFAVMIFWLAWPQRQNRLRITSLVFPVFVFGLVLLPWLVFVYFETGVFTLDPRNPGLTPIVASAGPGWLESLTSALLEPQTMIAKGLARLGDFWWRAHHPVITLFDFVVQISILVPGVFAMAMLLRRRLPVAFPLLSILSLQLFYASVHAIARYSIPVVPIVLIWTAYLYLALFRGVSGYPPVFSGRPLWARKK